MRPSLQGLKMVMVMVMAVMVTVASRFEEGGQEEERGLERGKPRRLRAAEELFQHSGCSNGS